MCCSPLELLINTINFKTVMCYFSSFILLVGIRHLMHILFLLYILTTLISLNCRYVKNLSKYCANRRRVISRNIGSPNYGAPCNLDSHLGA